VEEHKGSSSGDDAVTAAAGGALPPGSTNKRKLSIDGSNSVSNGAGSLSASGLGSTTKSRYTTLPPAFSDATGAAMVAPLATRGDTSPCLTAATPRLFRANSAGSNLSPDSLPLPQETPGSDYSTFSQAHARHHHSASAAAATQRAGAGVDEHCERLLDGSVIESPYYMPPPPDTPGSMASTPNFENLPRAGELMAHHLPDHLSLHNSKRPRTDY
jgi:hypothetical protein